ncbi:MAG: selenium cofactor biosynthesis protein YqeC [Bacillota bacterium]
MGAGGKTSLLLALAREAIERWGPGSVSVTTTTKMLEPGAEEFPWGPGVKGTPRATRLQPCLILSESLDAADQVIEAHPGFEKHGGERPEVLVLGSRWAGESVGRRKFAGIPPEWVDEIARRFPDLVMLVEADGAARKPLKAPAAHEPVIPASSTVVLTVAGLDALGMPLDAEHVHRPERLAQLTGHTPGNPVTSDVIATALWHPEGCGKGSPQGAAVVPVINKVDRPEQLPAAREVAGKLLQRGAPRVLLTSCHTWPVVVEAVAPTPGAAVTTPKAAPAEGAPSVAAIVLAAGASTRMGAPKQLLQWEDEPLIVRAVRQTLEARVAPVVVVLGHKADEIKPLLEPLQRRARERLWVTVNQDYLEGGQSSSVRAGLAALAAADRGRARAVVFVNCDQPLLRAEHIDTLVARFEAAEAGEGRSAPEGAIVIPVHDGRRGHPVLFGRGFFGELAGVTGNEGGRSVIRRHPQAVIEVPSDRAALADVDSPEDFRELEEKAKRGLE